MKKHKIIKIIIALCAVVFMSVTASAAQEDYYSEQLDAVGADEVIDALPEQAQEYMELAGIDTVDFGALLDFSPDAIFNCLVSMVKTGFRQPFNAFLTAVGTVILLSVVQCFFTGDARNRSILNIISGCFLIIGIFTQLYTAVKAGVSCISLTAGFELALIPAFAATVTASGNPALALSYSGFALAAAQGIEQLAKAVILPASGACLSLGITAAVSPDFKFGGLCETLSKTVKNVLSFAAAMFSSVLALKGVLARSADSLAAKGIKLVVSSAVPVVGGALSDAYSTVAGSLSVLNSALGVFGIAAVFMINAPAILQLLMWVAALRLSESVARIMGQEQQAALLKCVGDTVSMINVLIVYCMVVFIISCAIVLALRTEN